jgi:hypothetical protein
MRGRGVVNALSVAGAVGVLAVAGWRAFTHLGDLSGVGHIAGIWMALAKYLNEGVFYPPLEAGGCYAGTRYMPALFALIAGLARWGGDYLWAAKASALLSVGFLLAAVLAAGRRVTGKAAGGLVLAGLVLAFPEGLSALLSPHADALAVALTVCGLLAVERGVPGAGRGALAGLLFALGVGTKFSALAGPAAAGAFLLARGGVRPAARVLVPFVLFTAAGLSALELGSGGRFAENFRSLGSGGMTFESVRIGPARVAFALRQLSAFTLVWPPALATLFVAARGRRFGLWDWYLLFALGTTLLIFISPGTGLNHLLELEAASALAVGRWLSPPHPQPLSHKGRGEQEGWLAPAARALVAGALLVGLYAAVDGERRLAGAGTARELAGAVHPGARLLTEDASAAVLLGQRPVVMDAFAYRVLARDGRVDDRALAGRVARQEFDVLVLMGRVDRPGESLCPRFHFGERVTDAMRRGYTFDREVAGYFLFVPAPPPSPGVASPGAR